jgi:S-(hydroxymethyl)glutathione dehydrogenase/alcohol dehydrogenase
VLVAIKAAGICHTDYDSLKWGKQLVLGHEGAGVVVAVGDKVSTVKSGDKVILNWCMPCGTCFQCLEGNQHICENHSPVVHGGSFNAGHVPLERTLYKGEGILRSFNLGTLSTHTMVKEAAVVKISVDIPFASASIIGCGVMTGYGSVVNAAKVKPGSSVVVIGTGGVGLNVIQGARIAGAAKIIAVDVNPSRLAMAKQYGATHTLLASREDQGLLAAAKEIKNMTNGRGADYAFECTAVPALGAAPLAMVRNAGVAVQVSGIEQDLTIDMNLFEWDKIYINPLYGKCRPQIDFPMLLALYEKGDLILDEMVTQTYALDDLHQAFSDMLAGKNAKGVILM